MDRKYIEMHHVTDRYLQGTLSEGELAEFEERLTWDQHLLDEVEIAERLRDGLRASFREERYVGNDGLAGRFFSIWSRPIYAAAASFLLAISMTTAIFVGSGLPGDSAGTGLGASPVNLVPLASVRGSDVQQVVLGETSPTVLLVDAVDNYRDYRVSIRRANDENSLVLDESGMQPTYLEMLAIVLPPGSLDAGRYELTVEGIPLSNDSSSRPETIQSVIFDAVPAR